MKAVVRIVGGGLVMLFAFSALYVAAFHAPRPRGLDIAVVGTPAQSGRLQSALDRAAHGAFDVAPFRTEAGARQALLDTDVQGVLVPGAQRDTVLVAGALGAAPAQAVAGALAHAAVDARVRDLVPLPARDRRGLSSLFTVVGTLIPSLVLGVLLSVSGRALPARVRWGAVLAYALLAGLIAAFNVDVLVGALDGHFLAIAAVTALLAFAVGGAAHGLARSRRACRDRGRDPARCCCSASARPAAR